jgi:protease II
VILVYQKKLYSEKSPFILCTSGSESKRADLYFENNMVQLLEQGIVFAYPIIKGTNYIDSNFQQAGMSSNKLTHFLDLIKVAIVSNLSDLNNLAFKKK